MNLLLETGYAIMLFNGGDFIMARQFSRVAAIVLFYFEIHIMVQTELLNSLPRYYFIMATCLIVLILPFF